MERPEFDKMTRLEQAQNQACLNQFLGQILAEQETNRKIMEAEQKLELGELENANSTG